MRLPARNDSSSSRNSNSVFYALMLKVQSLTFSPFQMCVLMWLGRKGFHPVQPLGRVYRRGRRSRGGADFLAKLPNSNVQVAIQIRHWKSPLQRRAVDEFWGYLLRSHIPCGVIVCSSDVMKRAEKAAAEYPGRPIELVSCPRLCSSMAALELGVAKQGCKWELHDSFFRTARELTFASATGGTQPARATLPKRDQAPRDDGSSHYGKNHLPLMVTLLVVAALGAALILTLVLRGSL